MPLLYGSASPGIVFSMTTVKHFTKYVCNSSKTKSLQITLEYTCYINFEKKSIYRNIIKGSYNDFASSYQCSLIQLINFTNTFLKIKYDLI